MMGCEEETTSAEGVVVGECGTSQWEFRRGEGGAVSIGG